MTQFNLKILADNVPDNIPHKQRSQEIEELPNFLSVQLRLLETLKLISVGPSEPGADISDSPWLRTTPDGLPLELLLNFNGTFVPLQSAGVQSVGDLIAPTIQHGEVELTFPLPQPPNYNLFPDVVTFEVPYTAVPSVQITVTFDDAEGGEEANGVEKIIVKPTLEGFSISAFNGGGSPPGRTWRFNWIAYGPTSS